MMNNKNSVISNTFLFVLSFIFIFSNIYSAQAATYNCDQGGQVVEVSSCNDCIGGHCSLKPSNTSDKTVSITDPLGKQGSLNINKMIGGFLNTIMGVVGSIALLMFVYGGFTWMTAAGASDRVQKGKDIIIWATIGIFVIFASYGLVSFVLEAISG